MNICLKNGILNLPLSVSNTLTNKSRFYCSIVLTVIVTISLSAINSYAQVANDTATSTGIGESSGRADKSSRKNSLPSDPAAREKILLDKINQLEGRISDLESKISVWSESNKAKVEPVQESLPSEPVKTKIADNESAGEDRGIGDLFRDTTINFTIDGYYGYNFNRPIGHINLLRAYDVTSNSFSLNQAAIIIEDAPDVDAGRRFGARLDLQFGQATEALQGNPKNELRPQVYRNILQVYGTYIVPIGSGLTVDFGKWTSAIGFENNYTKDQINYSRSYFYSFLPLYHFGFRSTYNVNNKLSITHWLVNGIQESEAFNGFKSQAILFNIKPTSKISANINYFTGIENRDTVPVLNPGIPTLATQPGLSTDVIRPVPRGRTHIFDGYLSWNVSKKLILAGEADYFISRVQTFSAPLHVAGGVLYARYQFTPKFAVTERGEYLSDRGGLFSNVTQALKETTITTSYKVANGFLIMGEYRRDFSNQPFFLTNQPGFLKREQNTATLGLIWWFGRKEGTW